MEDVVPEAVIPRGDDEVAGEERADCGGGLITHLFSNFVNGGTDGFDGENPTEQAEKETTEAGAEGGNEEKGDGLFDHIISNLVSPLCPRTGNSSSTQGKVEASESDDTTATQNESEEGGGGGLISNFMSNLLHHSEGEAGEESNKRQKVEEVGEDQSKAEKTEGGDGGGGGGGGGIIDNIVSQLPASLPAPTSDEATILIHIVQD